MPLLTAIHHCNMETWFLIIISLFISALIKAFISLFTPLKKTPTPIHTHTLPPGPKKFPIIGNIQWIRKSPSQIENMLRSLHFKYGPMVTLRFGSITAIFISDRSLAHQALVQNGAVFADRPPAPTLGSNQLNITTAHYGPTWRLFRKNLAAEIMHPSRVNSYSHARKWMLGILRNRIELQVKAGMAFGVVEDIRYAMFCLLVLMCFGDKLDQNQIKEIERVEHKILVSYSRFNVLNIWPRLTKILLRKRWQELLQLRCEQKHVLLPLIRARKKLKEERSEYVVSYVDTLLNLELPDEKRKLNEDEIISLCSELLTAGTDTSTTAMQWIMANLVKYPHVQEKLYMEIKEAMGGNVEEEVKEEDLQKMPYLKGVILEGLRKHPPGNFLLPHAVTEDVVLGEYLVPKYGSIIFKVADMGRDPKVWEDPMDFKPERFVNNEGEVFDITGSREIKMMPFGVGRRFCPGYALAMLHLEYFVANLVWSFEWKAADGDDVDMSETQEFTMVMKNPLQAQVSRRLKK